MFCDAGWTITFVAANASGGARYARRLQQMGIAVFALQGWSGNENAVFELETLLQTDRFDVALFAFWYFAETHMPMVRRLSLSTVVIVDSVDIQFLRESRRIFAGVNGKANGHARHALDGAFGAATVREINSYAEADAVLTVSDKEASLINDLLGRRVALTIPDTEDTELSAVPFRERSGMLFVGNFLHPPNVEAVEYLCGGILPRVSPDLLARHPVYIVGNQPPAHILDLCRKTSGVRFVGWTPSVQPYLANARISLVPLRHGAGTKRKLMQSMMAGTPAVSTSIGAEGFDVRDGEHVLIADDPDSFAVAIERLADDADLWSRIARGGREFSEQHHGRPAVTARFGAAIDEILRSATRSRVFWEELKTDIPSALDRSADAAAAAEAHTGRLSGFCNTENVETSFVMRADGAAEDLIAAATGATRTQRILICGLSLAVFGHPHAALTAIGAHVSKNWLRVGIAGRDRAFEGWLKNCVDPQSLVSAHESSFDTEQFDIVLASDAASLEDVLRALKPGGLYCSTVLPAGKTEQGIQSYRFWSRSLGILGDNACAHLVRKL
jgi:hypothetical protein